MKETTLCIDCCGGGGVQRKKCWMVSLHGLLIVRLLTVVEKNVRTAARLLCGHVALSCPGLPSFNHKHIGITDSYRLSPS